VDISQLPQPTEDERKKRADLIVSFGSDDFSTREQATKEAEAFGAKGLAQLQAAARESKDAETTARCRRVMDLIKQSLLPPSQVPKNCNLFECNGGQLALLDESFADAECMLGTDASKAKPRSGYLFRVLKQQGKAATGGMRSYIFKDNNMTLGYALLAFPQEYGKTGKRCFLVNNNGIVFARDFGNKEKTDAFVKTCDTFDPDTNWVVAE
jgi:hypothetical protein